MPIPPDNPRSFLPWANDHTHQGNLSQHSFQSGPAGMDCNLWHSLGDHNGSRDASLFTEFNHLLGVQHIYTTDYYPCVNGMVERFHRFLKISLATRNDTTYWVDDLPLILLSLRNTMKEELGCSAAELVFGTPLSLPGQYFSPSTDLSLIVRLMQPVTELSDPRQGCRVLHFRRHPHSWKD